MASADEPADPFEGLVLDENFVRGGRFEAPARTREALARHPAGEHAEAPRAPRRRRRRVPATAVGVGILVVVVGAIVWLHPASSGKAPAAQLLGGLPHATTRISPSPRSSDTVELSDYDYAVGGCYTWNQRLVETQAVAVPCAGAHLVEAVERLTLSGYGTGITYPTSAAWLTIIRTDCTGPAVRFLGKPLDPQGRFAASAIRPVAESWQHGDRTIECTLGDASPGTVADYSGPRAPVMNSFLGEVRGAVQALHIPPGECEVTKTLLGAPTAVRVLCSQPHSDEYVGSFDLPGSEEHPSDSAFSRAVYDRCVALSTTYAGRRLPETRTSFVGADLISPTSWMDGNRTVNCVVLYKTANNVTATATGSVKEII